MGPEIEFKEIGTSNIESNTTGLLLKENKMKIRIM